MWTVNNPVGRLIAARWVILRSPDDAQAYGRALVAAVKKVAPAIVCADWSKANIMAPEVAPVMLSMISGSNLHVERSAILLAAEHATFNLQAERLVRDGYHPGRRIFRDRNSLVTWLSEVLTSAEITAVREHLFVQEGK